MLFQPDEPVRAKALYSGPLLRALKVRGVRGLCPSSIVSVDMTNYV